MPPILINGTDRDAAGRPEVPVYNPANGEEVGRLWHAATEDAPAILTAAAEGFAAWCAQPLHARAAVLQRYAALVDDNADRLAALQSEEMGKPIAACREEVREAAAITRGYAERAKHLYGRTFPQSQPGLEDDLLFTRREPLGVVLCIIPFNYPAELFTHKVIPALAMGNAVIAKVPDENPLMMLELVKLLVDAGLPQKAAGALCCEPEFSTNHILPSPILAAVSFTGSPKAGSAIAKAAAGPLHRVFLELGGNDPLLIMEGANLDEAVEQIIAGRIDNAGQNCCASKRFLVHRSLYNELAQRLIERLKTLKTGDVRNEDTELGYLTTRERAETVAHQIQTTVEQGATLAYGGERTGCFVQPAVLTGVSPEMDIMGEMEVFGPVLPLCPFNTAGEAIAIANQIPYGLAAGIFGAGADEAIHIAGQLHCGTVVLNGSGNYRHGEMPFGGRGKTGNAREGVSATLEEMSEEKTFVLQNAFAAPTT